MKNLTQMMKQAQEMQSKMAELQERLADLEIEGQSGAGMVRAFLDGKGALRRIKIDPALIDPNEIEVLEDLVVAAFNEGKAKVEATAQEETQKLMGGLKLPPGVKLPF